jgi:hypothetical protein
MSEPIEVVELDHETEIIPDSEDQLIENIFKTQRIEE